MKEEEAQMWRRLVEEAREGDEGLRRLFEALDGVLHAVARGVASQVVDDAVQMAHIKIWRSLGRVDLTRPGTIRSMLVKVGLNAMRDEVRKWLPAWDAELGMPDDVDFFPARSGSNSDEEFSGVLADYLRYVRENGRFKGAHTYVARIRGVTVSRASALFNEAVRHFVGEGELEVEKRGYRGVLAELLGGVGG